MTAARVLVLVLAAAMLVPVGSIAGSDGQFPHGLMSSDPDKKGCTIETRPLSFGFYDPLLPAAVDGLGAVIYTCGVKSTSFDAEKGVKNIRIEMSRGRTNSYSDRAMGGPSFDDLYYNVYLDSTHRTIWGDGTNGTDYYFDPHPPNRTPVTVPVYGHIPALQDVIAGAYADVLQVTIHF